MGVADRQAKLRDFLIQIALTRRRYRFKSTGQINAAALAKDLCVDRATISRILAGKRNLKHPTQRSYQYHPSPQLLDGLMRLRGYSDLDELWEAILNAPPPPPDFS
ncbi:MAG: hypothetical protein ACYTAN_18965 [Planctomycetota bacterium]|jgi:hypothetical protein